MTVSVTQA